ncbi:uncharacterized protein LOC143028900 [Oratosquilla oratoria]|uniref:uncharacterized protein LOC143028900 n=1 Tax=Oratosquilla oratoria TaxID=337810 RepID=UPI003F75D851
MNFPGSAARYHHPSHHRLLPRSQRYGGTAAQNAESCPDVQLRRAILVQPTFVNLLGLRIPPKNGFDASPTEMVYDNPLVIPGEFFPDTTPNEDLNQLRRIAGKFTPCRQTYKPANRRYVLKGLHSSKYVFLRNNTRSPPLTPPYSGYFEVVQRKEKAFLLGIRGEDD